MHKLNKQVELISETITKIAQNLRITPIVDRVKPGLTASQLMILLILHDTKNGELSISALAKEVGVTLPSVSGVIDRLYKEKIVERIRDKNDRRLVLVRLTEKGKEITANLLKTLKNLIAKVLNNMSDDEITNISKSVETVSKFSINLLNETA